MPRIFSLNPEDFPAAFAIEKRSHAFPWTKNIFFTNQGENYLNYRIHVEKVMAGFLIAHHAAGEATLFNIAIDPDFQRQGLAHALLSHLIEQLTRQHISTLWLEVRASNTRAITLYNSLGFNEVAIRANYYPSYQGREDAIVMALTL